MTKGTPMMEAFVDATSEAISTMAMFEVKPTAVVEAPDPLGELLEAACFVSLDLESGGHRSLALSFDWPVAKAIVSAMLGLEPGDLETDGEVLDGVGELGNMAAGVARAALAGSGDAFRFSLPVAALGRAGVPERFVDGARGEVLHAETAGGRLVIALWGDPT